MESQIVSADSLYATLHGQFGEYVKAFNALVPTEEQQVPSADAPEHLFLPLQLELSQEAGEPEDLSEEYGESVEFGIEQ